MGAVEIRVFPGYFQDKLGLCCEHIASGAVSADGAPYVEIALSRESLETYRLPDTFMSEFGETVTAFYCLECDGKTKLPQETAS